MQLQTWYKEFYNDHKSNVDETIDLIGIYHYDGMEIYCIFNLQDYINKKCILHLLMCISMIYIKH